VALEIVKYPNEKIDLAVCWSSSKFVTVGFEQRMQTDDDNEDGGEDD
jgi:hypothetical protein